MSNVSNEMLCLFEKKAEKDAQWAVAYSNLCITGALDSIASAIRKLGLNDAATSMGAIEAHSVTVKEGLESVADSIESAGKEISGGFEQVEMRLRDIDIQLEAMTPVTLPK
jgi:hypothetical protein